MLSRFRNGCSAGTDGVGVDVIMIPAWIFCDRWANNGESTCEIQAGGTVGTR